MISEVIQMAFSPFFWLPVTHGGPRSWPTDCDRRDAAERIEEAPKTKIDPHFLWSKIRNFGVKQGKTW